MDRLPSETQKQLKQISTARLAAKLGRAGYRLDRLEELNRRKLLKVLAEAILVEPAPKILSLRHGRRQRSLTQQKI